MLVERSLDCTHALSENPLTLTPKELVEQFLADLSREKSPRTVIAYRSDFEDFSGYLERHGLNNGGMSVLSSVQGYICDLTERDFSQATIKRRLNFLSTWAKWGLKEGHLEDGAVLDEIGRERHKVQKGGLPGRENKITGEVITQLFKTARGDPRDLAMFRIAYEASLQAAQIGRLKKEDFRNYRNGWVLTFEGRKTKLSGQTSLALESYLRKLDRLRMLGSAKYLFLHRFSDRYSEKGLTRQGFWLILGRYARKIGHPELNPRAFHLASLNKPVRESA